MSIREMAKELHRSPSTISREIKRNCYRINEMYQPNTAQNKYSIRRKECHRKLKKKMI